MAINLSRSAPLTGGGTVSGDLTVKGDLAVEGGGSITIDTANTASEYILLYILLTLNATMKIIKTSNISSICFTIVSTGVKYFSSGVSSIAK